LGLRDVLEEYDIGYKDAPSVSLPSDLTDAERRVLVLLEVETKHVDDIATRLDVSPAETLAVLTSLEIRGLVTQEPGKVFRRALDMIGAGAALPS
jgi:predicted Rossmann fold nucleotide-binding protein DprA/Smf involved in DNA uptake